MFLDLRAKFQKLKKKTQNSRKKLKLWEDFAPPERPSGVKKKPGLVVFINQVAYVLLCQSH